ncbi:ASST-domain-containing protein, partial [Coniella lustricola]
MFARRGWQPAPAPAPAPAASGPRARLRRIAHSTVFRVAVVLAAVTGLWLGGAALWATVLSRLHLHRHLSWYGLGLYGLAPSQQCESFEPRVPSLEFPRWDARCSQDPVFFGWRGHEVDEPGAVILDAHGDLVWRNTDAANIDQNDVRPQLYRGERFLTFQMDGPAGNQSQGYWYMLDQSYQVRHRLRPGNGLPHADMHEFQLTADDTALVITTIPVAHDLRSVGGPAHGWLEACFLQELDVETGAVLFQWAALDHFAPNTTMEVQNNCLIDPRARFAGCGDSADTAFDYLHLNSVAKDSLGNYLVSARNIWAVSYIDGTTGAVLWSLGAGAVNDFEDITDPATTGGHYALDFAWQHHARWVEEGRVLSLFDNHYHRMGDPYGASGGRVLELDVPNRTVRLRHLLQHPNHIKPESQGNTQHLDNGNYMVGWGSSGAFTEFAPDGEVLCDGRFGAEVAFEFSPVSSYRVFRGAWVGMPTYPPSVAVVGNKAYVSWNGATEVDRWQVESLAQAEEDEEQVQVVVLAQVFKDGFETVIDLPKAAANSHIRIVALSKDDERLGTTDFLE